MSPKEHSTELRNMDLSSEQLHDALLGEDLLQAKMDAFLATYASIDFTPDGTILEAKELFLQALGYTLSEIKGKHHRIFCRPESSQTAEYTKFWKKLA